ncbi:hypothetical protein PYW07_002404 [Mythimna separata]|uniref:Glycoprotein hormone subunit beta domain-containing protein n=1 Tax=Mythimna separata TaxID=271217 RepID=A0AAD8DUA1_MYTSE|nr:hypothetical protein PYW07_002404 [Mythimna separata]
MTLLSLLPILLFYMVTPSHGILPCKLRVHLARAEQTDEFGRKCWDMVKVPSCGGRCDSSEIADWEFPFKKSHHPVCVFGGRRPLVVRLRHCDPGVSSGTDVFHYIAAEDCRCKSNTENASTRVHAEKHAPPRVGAGRDARYGTPNPAVPRVILNGRDVCTENGE